MLHLYKIRKIIKILFITSVISFAAYQYASSVSKAAEQNRDINAIVYNNLTYSEGQQELDLRSSFLISLGLGTSIRIVKMSKKNVHKYT